MTHELAELMQGVFNEYSDEPDKKLFSKCTKVWMTDLNYEEDTNMGSKTLEFYNVCFLCHKTPVNFVFTLSTVQCVTK